MLRDLFLPARCASCRIQGRGPLCLACEDQVPWITPPGCNRCGLPRAEPRDECEECRGRFSFRRARAAARYEGPARDALKAFKLSGERRAARALAHAMLEPARELAGDGSFDAVAFVPATRRSVHERGFNPAEELARPIAAAMKRRLVPLLTKMRETKDQAGLGREERRANLGGAFASSQSPDAVLLVDDIFTTGATADACAATLSEAGAKRVDVLTFARAGRPPDSGHGLHGKPRGA